MKDYYKTISQIIIKNPELGEVSGHCVFCGGETKRGHNIKKTISNSFTAFYQLGAGACVCEFCYSFLKEQTFRRKSWIVVENRVEFLKRAEILDKLLLDKVLKFIYVTKTGQRQGWVGVLNMINQSRGKVFICTDWIGHFIVSKAKLRELSNIAKELRQAGISKSTLLSGKPSIHEMAKILDKKLEDKFNKIKKFVNTQEWEIIVYLI